jgi:GNAT superfamily N-acetyltransferase
VIEISDYSVDCYRDGDEQWILQLFKEAFGEERSLDWWRWKYEGFPGGTDHIVLLRGESGEVLGHVAVIPLRISFRGRDMRGGLYADLMVHPSKAGRGSASAIIQALTGLVYDDLDFAYSFPNVRSLKPAMKQGPVYLGEVPIYWRIERSGDLLKRLRPGRAIPPRLAACGDLVLKALYSLLGSLAAGKGVYRAEPVGAFGDHAASRGFATRDGCGCGIFVPREEAFLRWRFDDNPGVRYDILLLYSRNARDEPSGYAVLATRELMGIRVGFVVDILARPCTLDAIRFLLAESSRFLDEQGVNVLSCMMTGKNTYTRALVSMGFVRVPHRFLPGDLHLATSIPSPRVDREFFSRARNWLLTWADTDLV